MNDTIAPANLILAVTVAFIGLIVNRNIEAQKRTL